ncbi:MAG TPA: Rap1a/Tai family immunity protein [Azonexus sp.]|nr:Rap1a/Tai family immunity protein [Azonexus sp.]
MKFFWLIAALLSTQVHAYSNQELREDCQAAESFYGEKKSTDPYQSVMSARCIGYVAGFADGYAISEYLAETVGVKLNAFCLPTDGNLSARLVRAVLGHLDRQPPNATTSTAMLVASALAKTFPCADSLEPKK